MLKTNDEVFAYTLLYLLIFFKKTYFCPKFLKCEHTTPFHFSSFIPNTRYLTTPWPSPTNATGEARGKAVAGGAQICSLVWRVTPNPFPLLILSWWHIYPLFSGRIGSQMYNLNISLCMAASLHWRGFGEWGKNLTTKRTLSTKVEWCFLFCLQNPPLII